MRNFDLAGSSSHTRLNFAAGARFVFSKILPGFEGARPPGTHAFSDLFLCRKHLRIREQILHESARAKSPPRFESIFKELFNKRRQLLPKIAKLTLQSFHEDSPVTRTERQASAMAGTYRQSLKIARQAKAAKDKGQEERVTALQTTQKIASGKGTEKQAGPWNAPLPAAEVDTEDAIQFKNEDREASIIQLEDGPYLESDNANEGSCWSEDSYNAERSSEGESEFASDLESDLNGLNHSRNDDSGQRTIFNYDFVDGKVKATKGSMHFWKFRFSPGQAHGPHESVKTLMFDYAMAGFHNVFSQGENTSDHALAEEFRNVRTRLMEVWTEIYENSADKEMGARSATEKKRGHYTSESAFVRRMKRKVNQAVEEYIRMHTMGGNVGHHVKNPDLYLPDKVDIMALRYLDPCSFNAQIAARLLMLNRTDLMVIGSVPAPITGRMQRLETAIQENVTAEEAAIDFDEYGKKLATMDQLIKDTRGMLSKETAAREAQSAAVKALEDELTTLKAEAATLKVDVVTLKADAARMEREIANAKVASSANPSKKRASSDAGRSAEAPTAKKATKQIDWGSLNRNV
ncbi:unnamed protein product [Clonostachys rosea]|uniref:Uncharacterized protein n=1 Tax=Bionectria ochroleuca TaxID=29856 RepID=A0ABY6UAW7_BIOOC|nr:unnamed protein product [Clonostachys rosea]